MVCEASVLHAKTQAALAKEISCDVAKNTAIEQRACSGAGSTNAHGSFEKSVFKAENSGRQFFTPQTKHLSIDTNRKAVSVGSKRPNVNMDYETTSNYKRVLQYDDPGTSDSEVTMFEYARHGVTQSMTVPLMKNEVKTGKESIKLVFLNAFALVVDLHREGFSLKGSFNARHFLFSPRTKRVTLQGIEPQNYTTGDGTLDKTQFVQMIRELAGVELPLDIKIWLECIEHGGHDSILRRHINMQHSDMIFGEFMVMYHDMIELKDLDRSRFE